MLAQLKICFIYYLTSTANTELPVRKAVFFYFKDYIFINCA